MSINVLFIGDIFAKTGRTCVSKLLPVLLEEYKIDYVIANCENASHGRGLSMAAADEILQAGVNFITMGNHTWNNKEIFDFIDSYPIVRPANFSQDLPGKGSCVQSTIFGPIGILNLSGRVYMDPCDNPFECALKHIYKLREQTGIIFVDFHAEATAEKLALASYIDGLVTAVIGTHTHVATADERLLPGGTAFITDVGMTGPHDSIIGMKKTGVINKFVMGIPQVFEPATARAQLNAVLISVDEKNGFANSIERISRNFGK